MQILKADWCMESTDTYNTIYGRRQNETNYECETERNLWKNNFFNETVNIENGWSEKHWCNTEQNLGLKLLDEMFQLIVIILHNP